MHHRARERDRQQQLSARVHPGYYNNEGEQQIRSHLGDPYWPGFYAFEDLLQAWRDTGELPGLALGTPPEPAR